MLRTMKGSPPGGSTEHTAPIAATKPTLLLMFGSIDYWPWMNFYKQVSAPDYGRQHSMDLSGEVSSPAAQGKQPYLQMQ